MNLEEKILKGIEKGWKSEHLKEEIKEGITEERLRNGILNDVRQDAFKKLRSADEEEAGLLIEVCRRCGCQLSH